MHVIYEDNHLLVVLKPAGIPTQSSLEHPQSLETDAKAYLKKKHQKKGNVFLHVLHRLDKAVGGLVLFAKTSKALSRLQEAMREHAISRVYHALVERQMPNGTLEHLIVHEEYRARIVSSKHPQGKTAKLSYLFLPQPLKTHYPLVEITLHTGRYHQIRAQFAHEKNPLIGDEKYGSKIPFHPGEIALFHARLEFLHPVTKEKLKFTQPLPKNWCC